MGNKYTWRFGMLADGSGHFFIAEERLLVFVTRLIKNDNDYTKILKICKTKVVHHKYIVTGTVPFEPLHGSQRVVLIF